MSLTFDPFAPLTVPADVASTHTLKTVMFRGMDVMARNFVVRESDGVADGPYLSFHHYGSKGPARAGVYIDGKPGPEWHTYYADGTPNTIERTQPDGSVLVEGVKGKPVPVLGVMRPHPATSKMVKDGWWYDIDGRDALWEMGVEKKRWSMPLATFQKKLAKGGLTYALQGSHVAHLVNSLARLAEAGDYSPTLADAEFFMNAKLRCEDVKTMLSIFTPLGDLFVDKLVEVTAQRTKSGAHLLFALHLLGRSWDEAQDPLLDELRVPEVARALLRSIGTTRAERSLRQMNWLDTVGAVDSPRVLEALGNRLQKLAVYEKKRYAGPICRYATIFPDSFVTWAADYLQGDGKKAKGRYLVYRALGGTERAEAIPLLVTGACESNADARAESLQALKGLGDLAATGLEEATQTGTTKRKATAKRLLAAHRRRSQAPVPEAIEAMRSWASELGEAPIDGYFDALFPLHHEAELSVLVAVGRKTRPFHAHGHAEKWFLENCWKAREAHPEAATLRDFVMIRAFQTEFQGDLDTPEAAWLIDQYPVSLDQLIGKALKKQVPEAHLPVLLEGLATPTKKLRKELVDTLASLGESVVPALLPHLERDLESQRAAAQILLRIGDARAAAALQKAVINAPDKATRTALEEALEACGGPVGSTETASNGTEAVPQTGEQDWEAVLTKAKKGRALKWLPVEDLELKLADGTKLSDTAILGLITLLRKEHERPDPKVWALRDHLDPESAHQFGRALYNGWAFKAKASSSHKWAVYAIAPFVDERSLSRIGPTIDNLSSGGRHAHAGWLLEAYGRSKNSAGMDWVGYWADHGMTRSVSTVARRLVEQEARRLNLSVAAYKGSLDAYVREKSVEDDLPAQERALTRVLERSMVGGRVWDPKRFHWLLQDSAWVRAARDLVFDVDGKDAVLTDDGFKDVHGNAVVAPTEGRFCLLHPLEFTDLSKWTLVTQPFAQVSRETHAQADDLDLPAATLKPKKALDLFNASLWKRGEVEDAGWYYSNWMVLPSRGVGRFELTHSGIHVADPGFGEPVKADSYSIVGIDGARMKAKDLDAVAFSELQRALYEIFPKGRESTTSKGTASSSNLNMSSGYPTADHAPSNRAKCILCEEKVVKGTVRVVVEREIDTPYFTGKKPGYLHPGCTKKFAASTGLDLDDVIATVLAHTELDDDLEATMRA